MRIGEALKEISANNVTLAEKQQQVYDAGVAEGRAQGGYTEGFDAGRQAEYDAFWDAYQNNGTRKSYRGAFAYSGWTNETFKPKYDIAPVGDTGTMFGNCQIRGELPQILEECGVILDTSGATNLDYAFSQSSYITRWGVIDVTGLTNNSTALFGWCGGLHTIDKIIVKADGSTTFSTWFNGCLNLANVTFEGVIGQSLNISYTKVLSHGSIVSIISALSTETTDKTLTLSSTAVNNAFEGGSTGSEWLNLIATKQNWTISLV